MKSLAQTLVAGVTGAIVVVVLMGQAGPMVLRDDGLRFPDNSLQTTAAGPRSFYLTNSLVQGDAPLTACDTGYHMASLFEILDVSNLRYDFNHPDAQTTTDSGNGPPTLFGGWIRTGYQATINAIPSSGVRTCPIPFLGGPRPWRTNDPSERGTIAYLRAVWNESLADDEDWLGFWNTDITGCDRFWRVWCVSD